MSTGLRTLRRPHDQGLQRLFCPATAGLGAYNYPWLALIPAIIALAILGALYKPPPGLAET